MNNIRDHFPNLNEFCSTDSRAIIKWMEENHITRSQWSYKHIFDRDDIAELIGSCPNIEFMIDGVIEQFWDTPHIDAGLIDCMENIVYPCCLVYGVEWSGVAMHHHNTISTFIPHSYSRARARILIWCVSQLLYECTKIEENPFTDARMGVVVLIMESGKSC